MFFAFLLALQKPHPLPAQDGKEWIFYGKKGEEGYEYSTLGRGSMSGIDDLRKRLLPAGEAELRVWSGFGPSLTDGWVFRLEKGRWRATRLLPNSSWYRSRRYRVDGWTPKSGWKIFMNRLDRFGAWTLPDQSQVMKKGQGLALDGVSYAVEAQRRGAYRAYSYSNPTSEESPQAARFLRILDYIGSQFPGDPAWPKEVRQRYEAELRKQGPRPKPGSEIILPKTKDEP